MNSETQKNISKNEERCMFVSSIKKFSTKLFKNAVENAFQNGAIAGEPVSSKQEIYDFLSKKLNKTSDTIRKWMSDTSNGPGNPSEVKVLEEIFGSSLCQNVDEFLSSENSIYIKQGINKAYELIKAYLQSEFPDENEEEFISMCNSIELLRLRIPDTLYDQIQMFIKTYLMPMVYDHETVFQEEHSEEYGAWGENGSFIIKEPCKYHFMKMLEIHFRILREIEKKFDEFAMEHMRPYIL